MANVHYCCPAQRRNDKRIWPFVLAWSSLPPPNPPPPTLCKTALSLGSTVPARPWQSTLLYHNLCWLHVRRCCAWCTDCCPSAHPTSLLTVRPSLACVLWSCMRIWNIHVRRGANFSVLFFFLPKLSGNTPWWLNSLPPVNHPGKSFERFLFSPPLQEAQTALHPYNTRQLRRFGQQK